MSSKRTKRTMRVRLRLRLRLRLRVHVRAHARARARARVVDNPIAHGEKHQVTMGEDHQVAMTSLTSAAWPVLQRWVEECHEAAREKATRHIQSCLRSQMLKKWASAAAVIPPGLVSSSSDDDRCGQQ